MATILIILTVIALLAAYSAYAVRRDERGDRPAPRSHVDDPRFLPPAQRR